MEENGYIKYEISNFAKQGYVSVHNTNYWKQKEYLGFGVNASSFFNGKRYSNTEKIEDYIEYYLNNNTNLPILGYEEEMDKLMLMKEDVILTLRMKEGLNFRTFKDKFKTNFLDIFKKEMKELEEMKLILKNKDGITLTKRGCEVANLVWQKFI